MKRWMSHSLSLFVMAAMPVWADGDAARGEPLYQTYCARCHGEEGDGNGRMAVIYRRMGAVKPSDFTVDYFRYRPDDYLRKLILEGGEAHRRSQYMPPFAGELSDAQVADLIAYIRKVAEEK